MNSFSVGCEMASNLLKMAAKQSERKVAQNLDDVRDAIYDLAPRSRRNLNVYNADIYNNIVYLGTEISHLDTKASVLPNGNRSADIVAFNTNNEPVASFKYQVDNNNGNPIHRIEMEDGKSSRISCIYTTCNDLGENTNDLNIGNLNDSKIYSLGPSSLCLKTSDEGRSYSVLYNHFIKVLASDIDFFELFKDFDVNSILKEDRYYGSPAWRLKRYLDIHNKEVGDFFKKEFGKYMKLLDIHKAVINAVQDPKMIFNAKKEMIKATEEFSDKGLTPVYEDFVKIIKIQIDSGNAPYRPRMNWMEQKKLEHPVYKKFIEWLTEEIKEGRSRIRKSAIDENGEFWGVLDNGGLGLIVKPIKDSTDNLYEKLDAIMKWKEPVLQIMYDMKNAVNLYLRISE